MFTGIIEVMGLVKSLTKMDITESGGGGTSLEIEQAEIVLCDAKLGDSIAVNGICLTITAFTKSTCKFGISPETLRKTNLKSLVIGDKVNLERAMSVGQRFSGHFVQGHVDTIVEIVSIVPDPPNSLLYTFRVPDPSTLSGDIDFLSYIIPKGYVCLDGTSLTVICVDNVARTFSVMMIKYTQDKVNLFLKKVGDYVNIEGDQLAKYVEKVVLGMITGSAPSNGASSNDTTVKANGTLTLIEAMISRMVDDKVKVAFASMKLTN